jgi:hypothetical protein
MREAYIDRQKIPGAGPRIKPAHNATTRLGTRYFSSTQVIPLGVSQSQTSVPRGRWQDPDSRLPEKRRPQRRYSFLRANTTVIVGCDTLLTPTTGLPAMSPSFPDDVSTTSGPAAGWTSGGDPGQIGICLCPCDGCHTGSCALRPANANTNEKAKSKGFIAILA